MPESIKKSIKIIGFALIILLFLFVTSGLVANFNRSTGISLNAISKSGGIAYSQSDSVAPASGAREMAFDAAESAGAPAFVSNTNDEAIPAIDKKIIRTGNLNLKVDSAKTAAGLITDIAASNKGEVSNSSFQESGRGTKSGSMTIRVPFDKYDIVFNDIKKLATQVLSETSNVQDITEEYVDLEARLSNKRAEEQSFVALLGRWGKVEDVLAVTKEIARVRGEIEQIEGRQRYLDSQTDMSTITVYMSEDVEITPVNQDWRPLQVLKTSARELITNGQGFVDGLIRFVVVILPLLIIYALIFWLIYYLAKKIYNHLRKPKQQ